MPAENIHYRSVGMKWVDAEPDHRIIFPLRASCRTKMHKTMHGGACGLCSQTFISHGEDDWPDHSDRVIAAKAAYVFSHGLTKNMLQHRIFWIYAFSRRSRRRLIGGRSESANHD
jgi:hypothetical protein